MDDDLDFSNDGLLHQLQSHKEETQKRLNECRDGLQSTVDQISHIEHKREILRLNIEKEFEKTRLNMLYILDKRRKALLKQLDSEIDRKRELLLQRVHIYQTQIIEAAELQPEILKLEKYELNNNQHIQLQSNDSLTIHFNKFIHQNKQKFFSPKKKAAPQRAPPPVPPHNSHNDDFITVPSPALHNLPIHIHIKPELDGEGKNEPEYAPTTLAKKRLLLELEKFLFYKPPTPNKPHVDFICHRNKFVTDLEGKLAKYGHIESSSGSLALDLQYSINMGMNWMVNKTNPIVSFGSMLANGFKKKEQSKELKTIPPPLLIIYLSPMEKALAEQFAECLTLITNESGVIISVVENAQHKAIQKWLDPASINATKTAMDKIVWNGEKEAMHENDYAYNPDLESEKTAHCGQRSVLRVCILLYGESQTSEFINDLVQQYENKYNVKSLCGVEMKKVMDKAPNNKFEDCPNCYIGNIFYDENEGIVEGQETIFQSIAKCVFSPNEFDDEEINDDEVNGNYHNGHKSANSFQIM